MRRSNPFDAGLTDAEKAMTPAEIWASPAATMEPADHVRHIYETDPLVLHMELARGEYRHANAVVRRYLYHKLTDAPMGDIEAWLREREPK